MLKNDNFIIHKDFYDHHRVAEWELYQKDKKRHVGGVFQKTAHDLDNGRQMNDWTKAHPERKALLTQQDGLKRTTLRNTGDRFMGESHAYRNFLGD